MSAGRKGGGLALALSHFLLLPFPCPPPIPFISATGRSVGQLAFNRQLRQWEWKKERVDPSRDK